MKLALRFIIPLFVVMGFLLLIGERHFGTIQRRWQKRDLDVRANLIANVVHDQLNTVYKKNLSESRPFLTRLTGDERLKSLAVCSPSGQIAVKTAGFPKEVNC